MENLQLGIMAIALLGFIGWLIALFRRLAGADTIVPPTARHSLRARARPERQRLRRIQGAIRWAPRTARFGPHAFWHAAFGNRTARGRPHSNVSIAGLPDGRLILVALLISGSAALTPGSVRVSRPVTAQLVAAAPSPSSTPAPSASAMPDPTATPDPTPTPDPMPTPAPVIVTVTARTPQPTSPPPIPRPTPSFTPTPAPPRPPTAILNVTPIGGRLPLRITADASASWSNDGAAIVGYLFNFGDGISTPTQSSPTASHVYSVAGPYTISVTVIDRAGLSSITTANVSVLG